MCPDYHKNLDMYLFHGTFWAFVCVLWALWIIPLGLVCQHDARTGARGKLWLWWDFSTE